MSENGKWQLAFWIVTAGLIFLGGGVIANDRIRATEDIRIQDSMNVRIDRVDSALVNISGDLREIKAKMGIRTSDGQSGVRM